MIQFREIEVSEAMQMIGDSNLDNLFFMKGQGIACVKEYRIDFDQIANERYFKKEEIK